MSASQQNELEIQLSVANEKMLPEIGRDQLHPYAGSAAARDEDGWVRRNLATILAGAATALTVAGWFLFR